MKRGFTLIEMLVVVVILATLMGMVFRLGSIGSDSDRHTKTVVRIQRLENCLSGYYAAFGSYPPVKRHGSPDPYLSVNGYGIQKEQRNEGIWGWNAIGEYAEKAAWRQVEAACRSQPVACNYPFPAGYSDVIRAISDEMKELVESGEEGFDSDTLDEETLNKLRAGFDDGGSGGNTGRFSSNKGETSWREIQLFRFGLMSYLLPRYLVMMNGADDFFSGSFAQWSGNNSLPSDPFTGDQFSSWQLVKDYGESNSKSDLARLANIPSQSVCARWMPNLADTCQANRGYKLFGIQIRGEGDTILRARNAYIPIYSPQGPESSSYQDQYVLDGITVQDGWWHDLYYYSPPPHQKYVLWSAGPNGRTFPPWISRKTLGAKANECVAKWTIDDITAMSH